MIWGGSLLKFEKDHIIGQNRTELKLKRNIWLPESGLNL